MPASSHIASALAQNAASRVGNAVASTPTRAIARPHDQNENEQSPPFGISSSFDTHPSTSSSGSDAVNPLFMEKRFPHRIVVQALRGQVRLLLDAVRDRRS